MGGYPPLKGSIYFSRRDFICRCGARWRRAASCTWSDRYLSGGLDALEDHERTNGATTAECGEPDRGPAADCQIRSHEFAKIIIMSNISKARTIGLHAIN